MPGRRGWLLRQLKLLMLLEGRDITVDMIPDLCRTCNRRERWRRLLVYTRFVKWNLPKKMNEPLENIYIETTERRVSCLTESSNHIWLQLICFHMARLMACKNLIERVGSCFQDWNLTGVISNMVFLWICI